MNKLGSFTEFGWNGTSGFTAHANKTGRVLSKPNLPFQYDAP